MTVDYKNKKVWRSKRFKKKNPLTLKDFANRLKDPLKIVAVVSVALAVCFGAKRLYQNIKHNSYFYVKRVAFKGCVKSTEEDLYALSRIKNGANIFSLDIEDVANKILRYPLIKNIAVRKEYPDKIIFTVQERKPIAIVSLDNFYYIDEEGVVFKKLDKAEIGTFLVITGLSKTTAFSDNPSDKRQIARAINLIKLLKERETFNDSEVSEINLDEDIGITLFTYNNATPIRVGFDFSNEKFDRLARVFDELKKIGVHASHIDIDYNKKVVVKAPANG